MALLGAPLGAGDWFETFSIERVSNGLPSRRLGSCRRDGARHDDGHALGLEVQLMRLKQHHPSRLLRPGEKDSMSS